MSASIMFFDNPVGLFRIFLIVKVFSNSSPRTLSRRGGKSIGLQQAVPRLRPVDVLEMGRDTLSVAQQGQDLSRFVLAVKEISSIVDGAAVEKRILDLHRPISNLKVAFAFSRGKYFIS